MSLPVTTLTHMGWIANLKAKRAIKNATNEYNRLHEIWQEDVDSLTKLITVFTAASNGEDSVPNTLMQQKGEHTLWLETGTASSKEHSHLHQINQLVNSFEILAPSK